MKKTVFSLLCILFAICCNAQSHRFLYEYNFKMDSLDRSKSEKELMVLDIGKEGSRFYSFERAQYDSIRESEMKKAMQSKSTHIDFTHIRDRSKVRTRVTKKYPDYRTTLHSKIGSDDLAILYEAKMDWLISKETRTIKGLKAQKATCSLGGRLWTAWYTPEIPFQDGPYRFAGLPGLILEVTDSKGDHVFTFAGSHKHTDLQLQEKQKGTPVSEKKFNELWKIYFKDPAKSTRMILGDPDIKITMSDGSGRIIPQAEMIRNNEIRLKEKLLKNNNFIDLTLYR